MSYTEVSYKLLSEIFKEGAYSSIALNKALGEEDEADLITRIVLGVLDRNVELDYIIAQKADKNPKLAVRLMLKQGIYCLKYMNSLPDYAVINNIVELSKKVGKEGVSGFLNATLKSVARGEYKLPDEKDKLNYLSVKYSKPMWMIKRLLSDYSEADTIRIISAEAYPLVHIRLNNLKYEEKTFLQTVDLNKTEYKKSSAGGYYVKMDDGIKRLFRMGMITYQSEASMLAVQAVKVKNRTNILDICSAPGGKSIYMAELNPSGTVTACDLHEHRVELIKSYANRMSVENLETAVADATLYNKKFVNRFDAVLADAPCTGFGVVAKHPDILINKTEKDIADLAAVQATILNNSADYVKKGGIIVYSTCTVTKAENIDNINKFLETHKGFKLEKMDIPYKNDGTLQLLPNGGLDGFFIARLVKNG